MSPKDVINTTFMVKYIALRESRDGKHYLNIVLADSTGEIEARKWHGVEKIAEEVKVSDIVFVEGKVNQFQGRLQLIVNTINAVHPNEIVESDYIICADNPPDKMFEELLVIVDGLSDVYIKELLQSILSDVEIKRRLKLWPAGKTIHHPYKSGLLEHLLSCAKMATDLCPHYDVNPNYVIAGSILHDLCKIYELSDGPVVEYTEEGKLIGHLFKAAELIDRFGVRIKNFPHHIKVHLKHIVLSHHGSHEFGSSTLPQTAEALLVHHIDLLDSKMNSFKTVISNDMNCGHWSNYVKHLDRVIFKGELPTHTEYLTDDIHIEVKKTRIPDKKHQEMANKPKMASLLKNFKIEE